MSQMGVHYALLDLPIKYCRYGFSRICSTVSRSLIPNFSLIINAPNAILNDLALKPFSVGKFLAYSASNSDHGITWAIFTQRLRSDSFPHEGSSKSEGEGVASSAFLYTIAGGDARVLTYFTCLSQSEER